MRPRGFTLIELLVTIAILAMLMAISGAAYYRISRTYKEQGAHADLDVVIRQVRNSAVSANAPAFVEIDAKGKRVIPWVYRTVGVWHFEDVGSSALGRTHGPYHDGMLRGVEGWTEGKIGRCVKLSPKGCVDLGADPDYDFEDGGYLEAYVLPAVAAFSGDNYVFSKMGCYSLKIDYKGYLVGDAGGIQVKSKDFRLPPARWTKVAFAWDSQSTRLFVDDALVAFGKGATVPINDQPLLVGADEGSIAGLVDEVRLMALDKGKILELPPTWEIEHTCAPWNGVYFVGDGTLDMRYHAGAVNVSLVQENRVRTVSISMLGATTRQEVEKREVEAPAPPPTTTTGSPAITLTNSSKNEPSSGSGQKTPGGKTTGAKP
ncbi:MAG TPA: LamG-like jellyroll fold domain-containing protein [Planctomycetota bacterium]|nr:LamG-like jellyroll fold domain-containing protein [Planctomycetota bacterium]